jgi:hypothetical protein
LFSRFTRMSQLHPGEIDFLRLTPGKVKELGLGNLFYAGLLFAEGISLSLLKGMALRIPDRWVMNPKRLVISTTYKTRVAT